MIARLLLILVTLTWVAFAAEPASRNPIPDPQLLLESDSFSIAVVQLRPDDVPIQNLLKDALNSIATGEAKLPPEMAEAGDYLRYYEINPEVLEIAEEHFTYLADARERGAHLHVLHGDGRTVLERQIEHGAELGFDVLILDAFSSDAIPVHLLTREAFDLYWSVLKPDGVLAINISNRHVDLSPVVRAAAERNGKEAQWVSGQAGDGEGVLASVWVLVTSNRAFLDTPDVAAHLAAWPEDARAPQLWTDDFSNVLSLMRLY